MKTAKQICKCISLSTIILAVVTVAWLPGTVRAEDMKPMKGGEHQMMLSHIDTPAQVEALKPGDTIAMACPKCKTIIVEKVTTEKGHIKITTPGSVHLCSGCETTIVTVGTGKNAQDKLKHVCKACGSDLVFCCATTPEAKPTKGMETDK
jgi:hypothetical protein